MKLLYTTDRLELRILSPDQAPLVLDFYQRNAGFLEQYEPTRQHNFYTLAFQHQNMTAEYNAFLRFNHLRFWLFEKGNPAQTIGSICFNNFLRGAFCRCMVGYKLDQNYCGLGYMTEALQTLLPQAAKEYRLHRIEAYVMPSNEPSICLLQKLCFQEEGLLKEYAYINGKWQDHLIYSLIFSSIPY